MMARIQVLWDPSVSPLPAEVADVQSIQIDGRPNAVVGYVQDETQEDEGLRDAFVALWGDDPGFGWASTFWGMSV